MRAAGLSGLQPRRRGRTTIKVPGVRVCEDLVDHSLTGGNRNDVTQLLPLVDGVGPVRGKIGRPRLRADSVIADRGYDHDKYRRQLWARGVKPIIARRGTEHGSGLGRLRWVVERTFAWLHQFRRLRIRWERRPELHEAFMHLACAFICQRFLRAL
jgi:transposase